MYKPEKVWSHQTLLRLIFLFCLIYFTGKSLELNYLENGTSSQFKIYSTAQLICFDFVCWPKTLQGINQLHSTVFLQCCQSVTFCWGNLGGQPWLMKIHLFSLEYFIFPLLNRLEQPACNAGVRRSDQECFVGYWNQPTLTAGEIWWHWFNTDGDGEVVITDKTCHWLFQSPEGFKVHRKYHPSLNFIGSHFSSLWPDLCQFTFYLLQQRKRNLPNLKQ